MPRKSDARLRLIRAAQALFWQDGFEAVGIDRLCKAALVKKGTFYYFFSSKSDLALAAIDAHWQIELEELAKASRSRAAGPAKIQGYFRAAARRQKKFAADFGTLPGCPFGQLGAEVSGNNRRVQQRIQEIFTNYRSQLASLLYKDKATGAQKKAAQRKINIVLSSWEGSCQQARIYNKPAELQNCIKLIPQLLKL